MISLTTSSLARQRSQCSQLASYRALLPFRFSATNLAVDNLDPICSNPSKAPDRTFAADHGGLILKEYQQAINDAFQARTASYGGDEITAQLQTKVKETFTPTTLFFPIASGTGAINVALSALCNPTDKIFMSSKAHSYLFQANALAQTTHTSPVLIPAEKGTKLTVAQLEKTFESYKKPGYPFIGKPRVLYLAQPTETGETYSPEEMAQFAKFAHKHHMYFFVDGARFWYFAAKAQREQPEKYPSLKSLTVDLGVDAMALGGTKNGMFNAEGILFFPEASPLGKQFLDPEFKTRVEILRRQQLSRMCRTAAISAQWLKALDHSFGIKTADHANQMAHLMKARLEKVPGVIMPYDIETNSVFSLVPKAWLPSLKQQYAFFDGFSNPELEKRHPDHQLIRLMTDPSVSTKDVDRLQETLHTIAVEHAPQRLEGMTRHLNNLAQEKPQDADYLRTVFHDVFSTLKGLKSLPAGMDAEAFRNAFNTTYGHYETLQQEALVKALKATPLQERPGIIARLSNPQAKEPTSTLLSNVKELAAPREMEATGIDGTSSVVVVGCGPIPKSALTYLVRSHARIHMVDMDSQAIDKARDVVSLLPESLQQRVSFQQADAKHLDLSQPIQGHTPTHVMLVSMIEGKSEAVKALLDSVNHLDTKPTILVRGAGKSPGSSLLFESFPNPHDTGVKEILKHYTINNIDRVDSAAKPPERLGLATTEIVRPRPLAG